MMMVMAGVVAVVAVVGAATAGLSLAFHAGVQASTAADAAALAAAPATYPGVVPDSPMQAAAAMALANGARLVSCACPVDRSSAPRVVSVITAVPTDLPVFGPIEVRATARAEFDPGTWVGR